MFTLGSKISNYLNQQEETRLLAKLSNVEDGLGKVNEEEMDVDEEEKIVESCNTKVSRKSKK